MTKYLKTGEIRRECPVQKGYEDEYVQWEISGSPGPPLEAPPLMDPGLK